MALIRRIARPLLASVFISGGIGTLRRPEQVAPEAEPVAVPLGRRIPKLPADPEQLVRINGAVQLGAGTLLALGRFPRLAAFALAGTLVPTTLAGHRFWEEKDPEAKAQQRDHFLKNLSLVGGLLVTAADTHGKPSVAWRARKSGAKGRRAAQQAGRRAELAARRAEVARVRSARAAQKRAHAAAGSFRRRVSAR
ncbi:DoxX family protein [Streptomyces sp. NBC_00237]|uniref:DoxX family protein n=1 Tax=Streptomyces sp. NBC_00237 TaxID=2975687 RepID=UPI0022596959|nr:DoxX family protein [Streptomyces sp. NBC_00237]MCX5206417.1 DoxX family protein [Streptomyces sp. NBC_00237]